MDKAVEPPGGNIAVAGTGFHTQAAYPTEALTIWANIWICPCSYTIPASSFLAPGSYWFVLRRDGRTLAVKALARE